MTITEGDTAAFRCRVNASFTGWFVNETAVNDLPNPDINTNSMVPQDGGPRIYTLTIVGQSVYNTTSVQCFAIFFDTGDRRFSSVSELLIEGIKSHADLSLYMYMYVPATITLLSHRSTGQCDCPHCCVQ